MSRTGVLVFLGLWGASVLAAPPPQVIAAEVRRDAFVDRVEALGTLRANEMVTLTANTTELVTKIHFDDGQRVQAGDVLVEMSGDEERAQLAEARSAAEEARAQYERVRPLAAQGTAAKSQYDERRREWETAQARVAAVESRLADLRIRAPFSGVLGLRNLSVGALVRPGDPITTLDDDRVMKLEFSVPATYLDTLKPGLAIVAKARAYGSREFRGEVRSVDSRVDPVTRSIVARAEIPNPDQALRPGMLMTVTLLKNPRDALVVPESAILSSGRKSYALRIDPAAGNKVERREVAIGARRTGEVEVLAGLAAGDLVVVHGAQRVRDGQVVQILPAEAAATGP